MLVKCIFGTKMHFASRVSQTVFFECRYRGLSVAPPSKIHDFYNLAGT